MEVDNFLLQGHQIQNTVHDCINEERENLPELSVDEWNEIYMEMY